MGLLPSLFLEYGLTGILYLELFLSPYQAVFENDDRYEKPDVLGRAIQFWKGKGGRGRAVLLI